MKARGVFFYGKFVVMGIAFLALFTYIVMLLWNWLVPELFGGPAINYWQTLGILILSKILFTGLAHHQKDSSLRKDRPWKHGHDRSYWRKKFEEKMNGKAEEKGPQAEDSQAGGDRADETKAGE